MEFKIEKDIPLPDPTMRPGIWSRILLEMEVGDSSL